MGVRLNIQDNPLLRTRSDMGDPAANPTLPLTSRRETGAPTQRPDPSVPLEPAPLDGPNASAISTRTNEVNAAAPNQLPTETTTEGNRPPVLGDPLPLRLRNFRYLQAAESQREQELQDRQRLLEHRLDATGDRLKNADTEATRIDAQLKRARLESDLEMIASEIGRFRLRHAFGKSAMNEDSVEPPALTNQVAPPSNRGPAINLLA